MMKILYKIDFFSYWHCGSGLSAGADVDALVIRDKDGLPFIPGKTMKGLIREAVEEYAALLGKPDTKLIVKTFGLPVQDKERSISGEAFFSNAIIGDKDREVIKRHHFQQYMYTSKASTGIGQEGVASRQSLRRLETVVPCTLYGEIHELDKEMTPYIKKSLGLVKRIGLNRNRGLGRCAITILKEGE